MLTISDIMGVSAVTFVLSGVVSAAPTIDILSQLKDSSLSLHNRDTPQIPSNDLPSCWGAADAAWAKGKSAWNDGQGQLLTSSCDNGQTGKGHCWHDYFLVGWSYSYGSWNIFGDLDCARTSSCSKSVASLNQTCTTVSFNAEASVATTFSKWIFKKLNLNVTASVSGGGDWQNCDSKTTTDQCNWNDTLCHSIWDTQLTTIIHGYKRARCNSPANADGNIHGNEPDGDAWTHGMADFAIPFGTSYLVKCDGSCAADYTPGAPPAAPYNGAIQFF